MNDVQTLLETAVAQHDRGELEPALNLYRRILESEPDHWEALYLSGTALLQLGRAEEAIAPLQRVVVQRPDVADAANNLGIAFQQLGRFDDAVEHFEGALRARPDYEQALYNLGVLYEKLRRFEQAEECFRDIVAWNPLDLPTRFRLAEAVKSQARLRDAEELYRDLLLRDPKHLDARINLGSLLAEQNRPEEAAREFTQALELRPDFPELHANLSHVYEQLGRLNEAVASAERAVELNPDFAAGWNNLGIALRSAHRIEDAIAAFRKAVALSPDFALAEFNLGSTHLLAGNYAEGWPLYARRVESLGAASRETVVPRWQGERLEGQSLLVCADQGFGDAIQFARFLKQAKDRSGATIVFECQPKLRELMTTCAGADVVIAAGDPLPSIDAHIPLAVLPSILRIDSTQLSEHVPYLQSQDRPPGKLANLAERSRKLIGLVWQGNPKQQRDAVRSCPLRKLIPVLETPGALFVSLQVDNPGHRQLVELFPSGLPENLIDAREELHGFAETAALLAQLDLVITVDTSTAHLAGALGLPVWTMLCHTPDWRWHLDRNDSPWYPTMRLFRQPAWGNWDAVAEEICTNLRRIL